MAWLRLSTTYAAPLLASKAMPAGQEKQATLPTPSTSSAEPLPATRDTLALAPSCSSLTRLFSVSDMRKALEESVAARPWGALKSAAPGGPSR